METLSLWHGLAWPLARLLFLLAAGLAVAQFFEALNWTEKVARLARPLSRLGNLSDTSATSFSMAFFSGIAANSLLAEAFANGKIDKKELICANLFNSLPTYFLHMPTLFFITVPLIKGAAFIYVALTLFAALFRSVVTLIVGRFWLGGKGSVAAPAPEMPGPRSWSEIRGQAWQQFQRRMKKIVIFTVPIYTIIFFITRAGGFSWLNEQMAQLLPAVSWLNPQSMSIIAFHIAAEFTAGLAVAGALLDSGNMTGKEVVVALLVGNILSSPVRAVRHQFPYYAGIFSPRMALTLIGYNQSFRFFSIVVVTVGYIWFS